MQFKIKTSVKQLMIVLGLSTTIISCGGSEEPSPPATNQAADKAAKEAADKAAKEAADKAAKEAADKAAKEAADKAAQDAADKAAQDAADKAAAEAADKAAQDAADKAAAEAAEKPLVKTTGAFIEEDGVVVIEMESTNFSGLWKLKEDSSAFGGKAIEWTGENYFSTPGNGIINIEVQITNTGVYQFAWANQIGEGTSTTEANDSWLKIESARFYGDNGKTIVCPKGQDTTKNSCVGEKPEGGGKQGWFKVYRSGGDVTQFIWLSSTSDRDRHDIYAEFTEAGTYTIQVSGRSKHHIIDRLIMVNDSTKFESAKNFDESARVTAQ